MNMKLVVLSTKRGGKPVAVIENPNYGNMSKGAVALAWAKANGYEGIPKDLEVTELTLTPFVNVMFGVVPVSIGDEIKAGHYE